MGKSHVPIDYSTGQRMRFQLNYRREAKQYLSYCNACGEKVPEHEGLWIYGLYSLDDMLCEACGDKYEPLLMKDLRKHNKYMEGHGITE
jgi:hypothetical protein